MKLNFNMILKSKKELASYAVLYIIFFIYLMYNDITPAYLRKIAYHPQLEQIEQTVDTGLYDVPLHDGSSLIYQIKVLSESNATEGLTVIVNTQKKDNTEHSYEQKYLVVPGENALEGRLNIKDVRSVKLNVQGKNISEKITSIDVIEEDARVYPWLGYVLNMIFAGAYSLVLFSCLYLTYTININKRGIIYSGISIVVTALLFAGSISIWKWDFFSETLKGHLFGIDGGWFLAIAKNVVSGNNLWLLENLAAPSGADLFRFPLISNIYYLFCYFCGFFTSNVCLVSNLYYFTTFVLCVLIFELSTKNFISLQHIRMFGGILFAFSQYHFWRGMEHVTATSYFVAPLVLYHLYYIYQLIHTDCEVIDKRLIFSIIAGAFLIGTTDPMYAYFSCLLLSPYIVVGFVAKRAKAAYYSCGLVALIVFFGAVNVAPSIIYNLLNGMAMRSVNAIAAYHFGLKIPQLFAPSHTHSILHGIYVSMSQATIYQADSYLGIWAVIGFILLFTCIFIRRLTPIKQKFWQNMCAKTESMDIPFILTLLIGISGGFGFLIAVLGFKTVRTYDRISVLILCFSIASFCILIDYIFKNRAHLQKYLIVFIIFALGVHFYDMNPWQLRPVVLGKSTENERTFYQEVASYNHRLYPQKRVAILQMPYAPFPENMLENKRGNVNVQLYGYSYLNENDDIVWTHGAAKGSKQDIVNNAYINNKDTATALKYGIDSGFSGIIVYPLLYKNGAEIVQNVEDILGKKAEIRSIGQEQEYYFDLKNITKPVRTLGTVENIMTTSNYITGWFAEIESQGQKACWSSKEATLSFIPYYDTSYRIAFKLYSAHDTMLTVELNDSILKKYSIKGGENIIYSPVIYDKKFNSIPTVNILKLIAKEAYHDRSADLGFRFSEIRLEPIREAEVK